ncbi:hypothetical protein G3R49_19310 [Shewanella sp. WXL01]|uniref:DUF5681 domain-containing protein n=1 Tax=Shewanella sp. WXL01 TaxID=2709721 RepID=UPI0014384CC2|nr:hypothetical protein [Shewanella sp. WXL01]
MAAVDLFKANQWKKGQSGNLKGRPKGSRNKFTVNTLKKLEKMYEDNAYQHIDVLYSIALGTHHLFKKMTETQALGHQLKAISMLLDLLDKNVDQEPDKIELTDSDRASMIKELKEKVNDL